MLKMIEQYEWCYNFATYFGAECELCPHKAECDVYAERKQEDYKNRRSEIQKEI